MYFKKKNTSSEVTFKIRFKEHNPHNICKQIKGWVKKPIPKPIEQKDIKRK